MSLRRRLEEALAKAGALFFLAACSGDGPASDHVVLEESLDRLRSDFNADSGKVRAIFLVAPT